MTRPTLAMVAKEPVAGRVKTRLCPPCTPEEAAGLAAAAIADTVDALVGSDAGRVVVVLDGSPGDWLPPDLDVVTQRGGGLDERLAAAIEDLGAPLLIVGMDTPQITAAEVDQGLDALMSDGVDAVLGPAEDGGYWALGVRHADPACVAGVPMSRPDTAELQRARLDSLGWVTRELPPQLDVDTFDDAVAVARAHPHTRFARSVDRLVERAP